MAEQHTQGALELVIHSKTAPKSGWPCGIYAHDKFDEDDDKTLLVADFDDVSDVPLPTCLANARRFVACWNACTEIETERLEVVAANETAEKRLLSLSQQAHLKYKGEVFGS